MENAQVLLAKLLGSEPSAQPILDALASSAIIHNAAAGDRLFASGDVCTHFVLVLSGIARVQISTRSGRSVTLFRLAQGETCALTTSSLLSETPYFAEGIAETDMRLMMIPAADFQLALRTAPGFMAGLLSDYARRIASLTALVDRLTSRDLETELRALLEVNSDDEGWVSMSHQEIAIELGTAREVVSRRLKELERSGLANLGRGKLQWLGLSTAAK